MGEGSVCGAPASSAELGPRYCCTVQDYPMLTIALCSISMQQRALPIAGQGRLLATVLVMALTSLLGVI